MIQEDIYINSKILHYFRFPDDIGVVGNSLEMLISLTYDIVQVLKSVGHQLNHPQSLKW